MTEWIALLRGINVGGKHILAMAELKALVAADGGSQVRHYIQSGNLVFEHADDAGEVLASRLAAAVQEAKGFRPDVLMLTPAALRMAIGRNPFPEAEAEPKTLHLSFLGETPAAPDLHAIAALASETERFHLADRVFYLHAPDGIGRSKLAAKAERLLGVPATARNWRTVTKIMEMVGA